MQKELKIKSVIEVVGSPKEYIDDAMKTVIEKLSAYKGLKLSNHKIYESEKLEGVNFWSTFCEIEAALLDIEILVNFCIDFLPSSVEILEPQKIELENFKVNNMFNDFLARFHEYNLNVNNARAENIILKRKYEK